MPQIVWTPKARTDAADIWQYIAADNPTAANEMIFALDELIARLAQFPFSAEQMPFFGPSIRRATLKSYIVYYQPLEDGIEVIRILHGARRPGSLLDD